MISEFMQINVTKWGNSIAIRLPKSFANQINIDKDSKIELSLEKNKIVIKKAEYNLNDLMDKITPSNLHKETDTGKITGKEQW